MTKINEVSVFTMLVVGGIYVGAPVVVKQDRPAMIETCQMPNRCFAKQEIVKPAGFQPCVWPKTCSN